MSPKLISAKVVSDIQNITLPEISKIAGTVHTAASKTKPATAKWQALTIIEVRAIV